MYVSKWAQFREYLNSKEDGHLFIRSDMILYGKLKKICPSTISSYISLLMKAGLLKREAKSQYTLVGKLPSDMPQESIFLLIRKDTLGYIEYVHNRRERNTKRKLLTTPQTPDILIP